MVHTRQNNQEHALLAAADDVLRSITIDRAIDKTLDVRVSLKALLRLHQAVRHTKIKKIRN